MRFSKLYYQPVRFVMVAWERFHPHLRLRLQGKIPEVEELLRLCLHLRNCLADSCLVRCHLQMFVKNKKLRNILNKGFNLIKYSPWPPKMDPRTGATIGRTAFKVSPAWLFPVAADRMGPAAPNRIRVKSGPLFPPLFELGGRVGGGLGGVRSLKDDQIGFDVLLLEC